MRSSTIAAAARGLWLALAGAATLAGAVPAAAQSGTVDPNGQAEGEGLRYPPAGQVEYSEQDYAVPVGSEAGTIPALPPEARAPSPAYQSPGFRPAVTGTTYKQDDLIGAAEGLFGKGAEGVARMIQGLLKSQGEPNGYIVGREAGGAFVVGLRYGSGTLFHRAEGQRPVYWTGPSVGFDAGANAGNTFVLVYNLHDSEKLYKRFPAGEGQAYVVGGLTASYLRHGDTVLIPIRMGVGLRLGVNAGYMKFSKRQKWLPF